MKSFWTLKKEAIFITGGSGFIGSHLVHFLSKENHRVISLIRDLLPNSWLSVALKDAVQVRGSLNNFALLKRVLNEYEIKQVYHLGAQAIVTTAKNDPINTFDTNVMGTVNLLEASRQLDVSQIVVLITDKIFGNRMNAREYDPYDAVDMYSTSKICQDLVCDSYARSYGMQIARVRACNQYGLDYNHRIIPNTIRACLEDKSPVIYKGEEESKRQYMYVEDLVSGLDWIMKLGYKGAFNLATQDVLTQEEVVLKILELKEFEGIKPTYIQRTKPQQAEAQSLKQSDLGSWKPLYNFDRGIRETLNRYLKFGCY